MFSPRDCEGKHLSKLFAILNIIPKNVNSAVSDPHMGPQTSVVENRDSQCEEMCVPKTGREQRDSPGMDSMGRSDQCVSKAQPLDGGKADVYPVTAADH